MKQQDLPERIAVMLVSSDYARFVSRTASTQLDYLVDIASLHTRDELLRLPRLGRGTMRQIEAWLSYHGRRLRRAEESFDTVICSLEFRKRRSRRSVLRPPRV